MFYNLIGTGIGSLNVICGCMFAGKTEELMRQINVLRRAGKKVIVFFPKISERYEINKIVSHNQNFEHAYPISTVTEATEYLKQQAFDAICFDEVQFLGLSFYPLILQLIKQQKTVICAGMDKDFAREYTGLMSRLLVRADTVSKLFAICVKCNHVATRTQRVNSERVAIDNYHPAILVGGAANYEPRCNECFIEFNND